MCRNHNNHVYSKAFYYNKNNKVDWGKRLSRGLSMSLWNRVSITLTWEGMHTHTICLSFHKESVQIHLQVCDVLGRIQSSLSWFITRDLSALGHVRLNIQFCLIRERSCQRLIHNACEMALHPTGCAEITHTVLFPNTMWLSNDPVLHHFREPTHHLFFQLDSCSTVAARGVHRASIYTCNLLINADWFGRKHSIFSKKAWQICLCVNKVLHKLPFQINTVNIYSK